ncbi:ndufs4 NADH dehydrogenase Fe-S protein subunit [Saitoella coloradoensis]
MTSLLRRQCLRAPTSIRCVRFNSSGGKVTGDTTLNQVQQTTDAPQTPTDPTQTTEALTADVFSGAPEELHGRTVRIYQPTRNVMQSGKGRAGGWKLDWEILDKGYRYEHTPLMGWAASADYMQGTHLKFKTKEDAMHFAEKQGWDYYVQEPRQAVFRPKAYANQFSHAYGKLKYVHTK